MKNIECSIESQKENMLLKYPDKKELTVVLFGIISEMFQTDFDAIAQKNKRQKIVVDCVSRIFEKAREKNVKKQYAIDLLNVFLDNGIMIYLIKKLKKDREEYILAIKSARAELYSSQWSDGDSEHWKRIIKSFEKF